MLTQMKSAVDKFHNDEDGIEALQVVMIVALAAIILIAFMTLGDKVIQWMQERVQELMG
ncbi:hypothetical protein LOC68_09510 [Blastopirellula sp. JC732]|uniref:Uncharacterized protein n=1 Tax=Blastopirellula sediminis TaxID=2894196 RepID=A0A9X1SJ17_9BACT|nr:hypothetical protein [Blastopirellula sediminis]MCC9608589.1 hypothetical protein [Blastopirellula sediminis]MCC9628634.1 hypothetical protein [Blastopirellula sediminis]